MSSFSLNPVSIFQDALRTVDKQLENVSLAADALQRGRAPLPPVTSDFNEKERQSFISQTIGAIRDQVQRGLPVSSLPLETIRALLDAFAVSKKWEEGLDDRKLFLDYVFVFLSRAPPTEQTKELEHGAIKLLYRDLPHPPSTHMGQNFQFRTFNGAGNSSTIPEMGRSFTPYSRSCTSTRPLPEDDLPDPGLVFDMLERRDKFIPHPAGLSGLFFNWATTVIHSVFRTRRTNWNINETSSYVDLGILYGNTKSHCQRMRVVDGQGKIIPDAFAETRISNLPPGVAAIMIMFNRNHNYLAEKLLNINERKTWRPISSFTDADRKQVYKDENYTTHVEKQDYEIFQTARLINSLSYASVVLSDFLGGILGTQRDGSTWTLDIASERREEDHSLLERGNGNSCSVEFNVLYRLHPSMSESDEKYIQGAFGAIFGQNVNYDELTPEVFEFKVSDFARRYGALAQGLKMPDPMTEEDYRGLSEAEKNEIKDDSRPTDYLGTTRVGLARPDPKTGKFFAVRDPKTGCFDDGDLAAVLHAATSVPAAAFKARGVPNVMRVIEILGIEQARKWGTCTINEFRRFLGLRPYATFEEWNSDKDVAAAARKLYRTTENLELYVGLVAEEPKPVGDGAGLCPSFTMARAILADAICLVRGDRYLTYDATPYNLSAWGLTEGSRNTANASFGGYLGRLFQRGLPQYFPAESVYTHFPLVTPTGQKLSMDTVMRDLGKYEDYTFDKPTKSGDTIVVSNPDFIYNILSDPSSGVVTPYAARIKQVGLGNSFLSVRDDPAKFDTIVALVQKLFVPPEELSKTLLFFHDRTRELINEKNLAIINVRTQAHAIDVVKDVFRLVPVHWSSIQVAGLPLKSATQPHGIYYEQQLYQMLKEIYTYIYQDVDATLKIPLGKEAAENVERLSRFVKLSLLEAMGGLPANVLGSVSSLFLGARNTNNTILKRLIALKSPIDEVVADVIAVISTASIELSQIFTHVVDFYLAPTPPDSLDPDFVKKTAAYESKLEVQGKIAALALKPTADAPALLAGYVREALRLDPVVEGVSRTATVPADRGFMKYNKGDKLWMDYRAAGQYEMKFPEPEKIDPSRPIDAYESLQGDTVFKVLGADFVYGATVNVLRAVFSFPNVKRAKGPAGTLRRHKDYFVSPKDTLTAALADDPQIWLGDDGFPIAGPKQDAPGVFPPRPADSEFKPLPEATPLAPGKFYMYGYESNRVESWKDASDEKPINTAWRYQYCNPEDGHRLTPWATGLTLNYDE